MRRNVRHIRARNDEWVQVHRSSGPAPVPSSGSDDWWVGLLLKVGGALLAFWVIGAVLKALLPFLALGFLGWVGLKWFSK